MSEILDGVLTMPPHLWSDSPLDIMQRYARYKEASERIKLLEYVGKALLEYIDAIPEEDANKFPAMPGIDRDFIDTVLST
ncbi:MAG: hypothetical protein KAJ19_03620 [Gammaproteobacteria bacterium]|nr:hypothetical protein [Gammaproteobacteria bacterium]